MVKYYKIRTNPDSSRETNQQNIDYGLITLRDTSKYQTAYVLSSRLNKVLKAPALRPPILWLLPGFIFPRSLTVRYTYLLIVPY